MYTEKKNKKRSIKNPVKLLNSELIRTAVNLLGDILIWLTLTAMFGTGVYLILVYGIPLGNHEKDMAQVKIGSALLGVLFVVWLSSKLLERFFSYLAQKNASFANEINSKKWPIPAFRTVRRTLADMSGKAGLLAWDILFVCFALAFALAFLMPENTDKSFEHTVLPIVRLMGIWFVIRIFIYLYYIFRNYTKKLLHYCQKYSNNYDLEGFIKVLQKSLKEKLLYYSNQWIITEDFFIAYCETDLSFHPIAIPLGEMKSLRYEVRRKQLDSRKVVYSAVIVCKLRNGNMVDLYVGNRFKTDIIWRVLQYFDIPFENTLYTDENYEEPFEITVTVPHSDNTV